jgi:hypothetical protein
LHDQNQACPGDDDPDGSRDALTGRCEAFYGDGLLWALDDRFGEDLHTTLRSFDTLWNR